MERSEFIGNKSFYSSMCFAWISEFCNARNIVLTLVMHFCHEKEEEFSSKFDLYRLATVFRVSKKCLQHWDGVFNFRIQLMLAKKDSKIEMLRKQLLATHQSPLPEQFISQKKTPVQTQRSCSTKTARVHFAPIVPKSRSAQ